MLPQPNYVLIETSLGEDPAIVVVNSSLRNFNDRERFSWHLVITVECKSVTANGMPEDDEMSVQYRLEDQISERLLADENAIFLASITCRGERELLFRVRDARRADEELKRLVSAPTPLREWDYYMKNDPDWSIPKHELELMELVDR